MTDRTSHDLDGATLYAGDCREVMRELDAESVDAIVTDPPYGLEFMGRDWDHSVPGQAFWTEALRIAKPGAHLLAFGGTRTYHRLACAIEDAGWEIRDCIMWVYGSGFTKSRNLNGDWSGWGTALKPAVEPIVVARKPLIGTVADNVQRFGTGAINVDGCRVKWAGPEDAAAAAAAGVGFAESRVRGTVKQSLSIGSESRDGINERYQPDKLVGRWPANVVHDGSEEVLAGFPELGKAGIAIQPNAGGQAIFGGIAGNKNAVGKRDDSGCYDSGSAARFFYTAKADSDERGPGNNHPTVKPLSLMRWLVRLVTPPGGKILDPFAGTGTTLRAARLEGFRAIGIEKSPEYVEIARKRFPQRLLPMSDP